MAREMKESGIEWIGKVPEGWNIIRFKFLHTGSNVGESIDKDYWTDNNSDKVFFTAGLVPISTNFQEFPDWKYTKKDDLLLARNGTPYVYLPPVGSMYSDHIIRVSVNKQYDKRYVRYCLERSIGFSIVDTVSIATWSVSLWDKQCLSMPEYKKQVEISDYLDAKCAEIDAILEKTRVSIEEYKKLRQAVITQAVIKGVRGKREMKESGIEWATFIPKKWSVKRGKQLFCETDERSETGKEVLLAVSHITGITPRSQKNVNMFMSESLVGYKICHVGDIAANTMWMWQGAVGVSKFDGIISPSYNTYRQIDGTYDSEYLDYLLRIKPLVDIYSAYSTGITVSRLRLYPEQFLSISFIVPPKQEQREIVEYLNTKTIEIDKLIAKKEQFIIELESYKKSLIYEYVTGKREVEE